MADYVELKSNNTVNRTIRRPTAYPQIPHIAGAFMGSLLAGDIILATPNDFYTYAGPINYVAGGTTYQAYAGDKWWRVMVNDEEGWIAEIHKGVRYLDVRVVTTTPPETLPTLTIEVFDTQGKYTPVTVQLIPK